MLDDTLKARVDGGKGHIIHFPLNEYSVVVRLGRGNDLRLAPPASAHEPERGKMQGDDEGEGGEVLSARRRLQGASCRRSDSG